VLRLERLRECPNRDLQGAPARDPTVATVVVADLPERLAEDRYLPAPKGQTVCCIGRRY
jgi:hypothetical protein